MRCIDLAWNSITFAAMQNYFVKGCFGIAIGEQVYNNNSNWMELQGKVD
jgi:hypothetical protein